MAKITQEFGSRKIYFFFEFKYQEHTFSDADVEALPLTPVGASAKRLSLHPQYAEQLTVFTFSNNVILRSSRAQRCFA